MSEKNSAKYFIIKQTKSEIGTSNKTRLHLKSLSLSGIGSSSKVLVSSSSEGLVRLVSHLISFEVK